MWDGKYGWLLSGVACARAGPVPSPSCALEWQLLYLGSAFSGLKQHLVPTEPVSLLMRGFYDEHGRSELRRVLADPFSATRLVQEFELEGERV